VAATPTTAKDDENLLSEVATAETVEEEVDEVVTRRHDVRDLESDSDVEQLPGFRLNGCVLLQAFSVSLQIGE